MPLRAFLCANKPGLFYGRTGQHAVWRVVEQSVVPKQAVQTLQELSATACFLTPLEWNCKYGGFLRFVVWFSAVHQVHSMLSQHGWSMGVFARWYWCDSVLSCTYYCTALSLSRSPGWDAHGAWCTFMLHEYFVSMHMMTCHRWLYSQRSWQVAAKTVPAAWCHDAGRHSLHGTCKLAYVCLMKVGTPASRMWPPGRSPMTK